MASVELSSKEDKPSIGPLLREFIPLALLMTGQSVLALTVNLVDNFMLGIYDEYAMAAATQVNMIQFILQQLTNGAGIGVAIIGAQYWGKGDTKTIKKIIVLGLIFSMAAGLLFSIVSFLFPYKIMSLLVSDQILTELGVDYLRLMCWTYIIFSISSLLMYSLRAVQTAWIGMAMAASTVVINICLNYIFIYGNLGAPELGIRGAALATLASRTVELVIIFVYVLVIDKKLKMKFCEFFCFPRGYLKDYVKVAFPVLIAGLLWGVASTAQAAILGHISPETVAANGVSNVIFQLFATYGFAQVSASSVIIGKTIGSGKMHYVKPYARYFQVIFIIVGVVTGLLLIALRGPIIGLYSLSPESAELTDKFLLILGITVMFTMYEYPVEGGIIAGGGNTVYQAWCDNLFMWLYTIPFSYLSAFVFCWDPVVTFFILKSDQILKCIPNAIVCNRYKWTRNLTRDSEEEASIS